MKNNPYQLKTPEEVASELASKIRQLRLTRKWKQKTLAEKAGISLGSLRRFEQTGQISLQSLLRLFLVLGRIDDLNTVLLPNEAESIRELEAKSTTRDQRRGTK
jgi:transcriptional regulator with XRE-family HTH domain